MLALTPASSLRSTSPSQCLRCCRLREGARTCAAFPQGIPRALYFNERDHRQPYPGDGGFRFAPKLVSGPSLETA